LFCLVVFSVVLFVWLCLLRGFFWEKSEVSTAAAAARYTQRAEAELPRD
jgi:hypothetical protein